MTTLDAKYLEQTKEHLSNVLKAIQSNIEYAKRIAQEIEQLTLEIKNEISEN